MKTRGQFNRNDTAAETAPRQEQARGLHFSPKPLIVEEWNDYAEQSALSWSWTTGSV